MTDVENWMNRYFEGETTLEEEHLLCDYLSSHEVPACMQCDKDLILGLHDDGACFSAPEGAEERLSAKIDEWAANEKKDTVGKTVGISYQQWTFAGIAASFLILFMLGIPILRNEAHRDTCDTPETACIQADKALAFFSKKMSVGIDGVEKVKQVTENVNKKVEKYFNLNENEK